LLLLLISQLNRFVRDAHTKFYTSFFKIVKFYCGLTPLNIYEFLNKNDEKRYAKKKSSIYIYIYIKLF